ncbi:MAG: hypothetical protein KC415_03785, partial [Anaerolineales bacterium]|nr:hypothetical protein [Anaerolineales bacterium]
STIGDFVWRDLDTDGVQDGGGETGIAAITVSLYWDKNGDGLLDDGDVLIDMQDTTAGGGYDFTQLPIGNYIVTVDGFDPDLPTGYNYTTPKIHAVNITVDGTDYNDADFGFGPILDLTKSLINGEYDNGTYDNLYEGQLANYIINVINTRPAGTGPGNTCEYPLWAGLSEVTGNSNTWWDHPSYAESITDGNYAVATIGNNPQNMYQSLFGNLSPQGTLNSVKLVLYAQEITDLAATEFLRVIVNSDGASDTFDFYGNDVTYFTGSAGTTYVIEITNWTNIAWTWDSFSAGNLNPPTVQLVADKTSGNNAGQIGVDAVAFVINTDEICGDPGDTLNPVPVTDTYDPEELEFVSANPPVSSQSAGTLTWNNVGPLEAGETQQIEVVFKVLTPLTNPDVFTNTAETSGAKYLDGRSANDANDSVAADVYTAYDIGDTVWFDADGSSTQNGAEPGLAGVVVQLYVASNDDVFYQGQIYSNGDLIITTTTDTNGNYLFEGLPAGVNYDVVINETASPILTNLTSTTGGDTQTSNLGTADDLARDFGYNGGSIVYGSVWHDIDADADNPAIDTNETYIGGVQVCLDTVSPSTCTTTDENGLYQFTNVSDGSHTIIVDPPGTQVSEPNGQDSTQTCGTCNNQYSITVASATETIYGGYDFGYTGANIGDTIYIDWDGNGQQGDGNDANGNEGEPGIPNVDVYLYRDINGNGIVDAEDTLLETDTTDSNGNYLFTDINTGGYPAGSYLVIVDSSDLPTGYVPTGDPDGTLDDKHAFSTDGVNDKLDVDFGYQPQGTATIGDYVWGDLNRNTAQDSSESGIPDISVNLYVDDGDGIFEPGTDDAYVGTTSTDTNGLYEFSNVYANGTLDYWVQVDEADPQLPTSNGVPYVLTTNNNPTAVTNLAVGDAYLDADFGFTPSGSIGDTIYWDANSNAEQDWNEEGIPGVNVTLEIWNGSAWVFYASDITDANGNYLFSGLPSGQYRVVVDTSSAPINGRTLTGDPDTNGIPCDPDPGAPWTGYCDSQTETIDLGPGQTFLGADFGYIPVGIIGDFVWLDGNGDGNQDSAEPGIADVRVWLCNSTPCDASTAVLTTTTDYEGYYSFINIGAGTWTVTVDTATLPTGLTPTYDLDSNTTSPDSETAVTLAAAGDSNLNADFGYRYFGNNSLSGTVFHDDNDNTLIDTGEDTRYEGVTIYLYRLDDGGDGTCNDGNETVVGLTGTTTTDASGNYSFGNLADGCYVVSVNDEAPNLTGTDPTATTSPTTYHLVDLDANEDNVNGESSPDNDFGFLSRIDLGDLPGDSVGYLDYGITTLNENGARHIIPTSGAIYLGNTIGDTEPNGQPTNSATGDGADEDGVALGPGPGGLMDWDNGANGGSLNITIHGSGWLVAWIDFNEDGDFNDAGEMVISQAVSDTGGSAQNFLIDVPADTFCADDGTCSGTEAQPSLINARFRLFAEQPYNPAAAYTGLAINGEVEDYQWTTDPTAVSLQSFNSSPTAVPFITLLLTLGMAFFTALILRRRSHA